MVLETELRKLREEMQQLRADVINLLHGRQLAGNWIKQDVACAMLNVKPRQLQRIRKHADKNGYLTGSITWRKGHGRTVEYSKKDIEAYLNKIVVR